MCVLGHTLRRVGSRKMCQICSRFGLSIESKWLCMPSNGGWMEHAIYILFAICLSSQSGLALLSLWNVDLLQCYWKIFCIESNQVFGSPSQYDTMMWCSTMCRTEPTSPLVRFHHIVDDLGVAFLKLLAGWDKSHVNHFPPFMKSMCVIDIPSKRWP
jgi:hypothetical protein